MKILLALLLSAAAILISAFSWGLVLYKGYYWFIVDVFNLPPLSYFQSVGVVMFIHGIKGGSSKKYYIEISGRICSIEEDDTYNYILLFTLPFISLLAMYIVKSVIS